MPLIVEINPVTILGKTATAIKFNSINYQIDSDVLTIGYALLETPTANSSDQVVTVGFKNFQNATSLNMVSGTQMQSQLLTLLGLTTP